MLSKKINYHQLKRGVLQKRWSQVVETILRFWKVGRTHSSVLSIKGAPVPFLHVQARATRSLSQSSKRKPLSLKISWTWSFTTKKKAPPSSWLNLSHHNFISCQTRVHYQTWKKQTRWVNWTSRAAKYLSLMIIWKAIPLLKIQFWIIMSLWVSIRCTLEKPMCRCT